METKIKIQKLGNDLGINIPAIMARDLALREGHYVNVQEIGNKIVIDLSKGHTAFTLRVKQP